MTAPAALQTQYITPIHLAHGTFFLLWWEDEAGSAIDYVATRNGKLLLFSQVTEARAYAEAQGAQHVEEANECAFAPLPSIATEQTRLLEGDVSDILNTANFLEDIAHNLGLPAPTEAHIPLLVKLADYAELNITPAEHTEINELVEACNVLFKQLESKSYLYQGGAQ